MAQIETYVFLSLGTTGEHPKEADITELAMVAVRHQHLLNAFMPRVQHKLVLWFKVDKQISDVARSSKHANEDPGNGIYFDTTCFKIIDQFLETLGKPVCLVTYGDYRLLKRYLTSLNVRFSNDNLFCAYAYDILRHKPSTHKPGPSNDGSLSAENTLDMKELNESTPSKKPRIEELNIKQVRADKTYFAGGNANTATEGYELKDVDHQKVIKAPEGIFKAELECFDMLKAAVELGQKFVDSVYLLRFPDDI